MFQYQVQACEEVRSAIWQIFSQVDKDAMHLLTNLIHMTHVHTLDT